MHMEAKGCNYQVCHKKRKVLCSLCIMEAKSFIQTMLRTSTILIESMSHRRTRFFAVYASQRKSFHAVYTS